MMISLQAFKGFSSHLNNLKLPAMYSSSLIHWSSMLLITRPKNGLIDRSRVPKLIEEDLEEAFVRGSGPGGQSVNKTANCVVLKHKPTGFVVKCHESRLLDRNRVLARNKMITKLDNHLNGQLSVESQIKARDHLIKLKREAKAKRHRLLKEQWKLEGSSKKLD